VWEQEKEEGEAGMEERNSFYNRYDRSGLQVVSIHVTTCHTSLLCHPQM